MKVDEYHSPPQKGQNQNHQRYQYYHNNTCHYPYQGMVYPPPLQPSYLMPPYPLMLPAYGFPLLHPWPYYKKFMKGSYARAGSFESSFDDSEWLQEHNDHLSNIYMRTTFNPEEAVAWDDRNQGEGQEPVGYDLEEEWISYLGEWVVPGDNNWMEESILQQLKTRKYQTPEAPKQVGEKEAEICAMCLGGYENQEALAILECGHEYHANCIKKWLIKQNVCPVCYHKALPQEF